MRVRNREQTDSEVRRKWLSDVMRTCRPIRRYNSEPVSDEVLLECLRLAVCAPSGSNQQKWRFCILRSSEVRELLGATYRQGWADYAKQMGLERPVLDDTSKRGRFIRSMFELVENFDTVPAYVLFCALRTPFMEELYTGASSTLQCKTLFAQLVRGELARSLRRGIGSAKMSSGHWSECRKVGSSPPYSLSDAPRDNSDRSNAAQRKKWYASTTGTQCWQARTRECTWMKSAIFSMGKSTDRHSIRRYRSAPGGVTESGCRH
jgi:hypothetical protein